MKPQLVLQFLIEGPGGFNTANVMTDADEALQIIRDWQNGGMRKGIFGPKSGQWAIMMDGVKAIFSMPLAPSPAGQGTQLRQYPPPQYSGN